MKRKILSLILCGCLVAGMFPAMAVADETPAADTPAVTDVTAPEGDATSGVCGTSLAWSYDSATQTLSITGSGAMDNYTPTEPAPWAGLSFTSVKVGEGVTSLGDFAFANCTDVFHLVLPNTLKTIGYYAFSGCTGLADVTLPDSITSLSYGVFIGCSNLISVVLPQGIDTIGESTFSNCSNLKELTIPAGVQRIDIGAFDNCYDLTLVNFLGTQAQWDAMQINDANYYLFRVETLLFGDGSARGVCGNNVSWTYTPDSKALSIFNTAEDHYLYYFSSAEEAPWYGLDVTSAVVEEGINTIPPYAFSGLSNLKSISLPKSLTTINGEFFPDNGVAITYAGTWEQWYNLNAYTLSPDDFQNLTVLGGGEKPTTLTGKSTYENYNLAWTGDIATGKVTITGTGELEIYAFDSLWYGRSHVFAFKSLEIGSGITSVSDYVFSYDKSLTSVTLPNTLEKIGASAFAASGLTSVEIPSSVTAIGYGAFQDCTDLKTATLPASLKELGTRTFDGCTSLETINFTGTQAQWDALVKNTEDLLLPEGVKVVCNYVPGGTNTPTTGGENVKVEVTVSGEKAETTVDGVSITMSNAGKVFAAGTVISVEKVVTGTIFTTVEKALKNLVASMDHTAIFEFNATKDSAAVQPDGTLSVTFALPANLTTTNLRMYYVAADGTYEEVQITVDANAKTVTANLTHFSTYVLANVVNPDTGDSNQLMIPAAMFVMALAGLTILLVNKRRA